LPLKLSDFDYELPAPLIAQAPPVARTASRLLHVDRSKFADLGFADLPSLVAPGDLVVFNDTRVIRARLHGVKPTGGRVEALVERVVGDDEAWAQLKASHMPKPGTTIAFGGATATVIARADRLFHLRFALDMPLLDWLERHGEVPLPPYIARAAVADDATRYQTVYARHAGAVAAPTAGLHFDRQILRALQARGATLAYVTLHVGAGTFQPVEVDDLTRHRMHAERYDVPPATAAAIAATRARGGRILAVGTTSLRALESAAAEDGTVRAGADETTLFVTPGYRFRVVDRLLTNFHLPRSTLLMLVSAFAGMAATRAAYAHAIAARYRFFSYGDAMLIERAPTNGTPRAA
jgi:S-adenosylmethionine:tRNA ribosyltransferase-isomerase